MTPKLHWTGSPPRMRGKVDLFGQLLPRHRITPAYAGKRDRWFCCRRFFRDHPRVCGEKRTAQEISHRMLGSPPRMRGKARPASRSIAPSRITPACAGKRQHQLPGGHCKKDHPRVCGEKSGTARALGRRSGSPPRVRGKVLINL